MAPARAPVAVDLLLDPFAATWAQMADAAAAARDDGRIAGLWTWDHLSGAVHREADVLECWTTLAALAPTVPGLTIGPMVLNVANRHPGVLARMAATLQQVAGGRLVLGLGAGGGASSPYVLEQRQLGRPVEGDGERRRQVEATVAELRRLWSGSVEGFATLSKPPPVVIGAFGPKMAALAGRVGDGVNTQAGHPQLASLLDTARSASASPDAFLCTVFGGFDRALLDPAGPRLRRLADLGVHRIALIAHPGSVRAALART